MYYLRTRAAVDAIKFTVDQEQLAQTRKKQAAKQKEGEDQQEQEAMMAMACSLENPESCLMCSG